MMSSSDEDDFVVAASSSRKHGKNVQASIAEANRTATITTDPEHDVTQQLSRLQLKEKKGHQCISMLEKIQSSDHKTMQEIKAVISIWKDSNRSYQEYATGSTSSETARGDLHLPVEKLKQDLYGDPDVKKYIQEIFRKKEGQICIKVDHGAEPTVSHNVSEKYPQYDLKHIVFLEEKGEDNFTLLGAKRKPIKPLNAIGPGSCLINVEEKFVKSRRPEDKDLISMPVQGKGKGYGTLGCFAYNYSNSHLFCVSAKHIVVSLQDKGDDMHMVSGYSADKMYIFPDVFMENQHISVKFSEAVYLSNQYHGILCDHKTEPHYKCDLVLFGPVLDDTLHMTHELFTPDGQMHELDVFKGKGSELIDRKVIKAGAITGLTRGVILAYRDNEQSFVVTSIKEENGQSIYDTNCDFASKGDSGALVLFDEPSTKHQAVGIISTMIGDFEHNDGKIYHDVILCVRLDNSLQALQQKKIYENIQNLKLFFCYLQPKVMVSVKRETQNTEGACTESSSKGAQNVEASGGL